MVQLLISISQSPLLPTSRCWSVNRFYCEGALRKCLSSMTGRSEKQQTSENNPRYCYQSRTELSQGDDLYTARSRPRHHHRNADQGEFEAAAKRCKVHRLQLIYLQLSATLHCRSCRHTLTALLPKPGTSREPRAPTGPSGLQLHKQILGLSFLSVENDIFHRGTTAGAPYRRLRGK